LAKERDDLRQKIYELFSWFSGAKKPEELTPEETKELLDYIPDDKLYLLVGQNYHQGLLTKKDIKIEEKGKIVLFLGNKKYSLLGKNYIEEGNAYNYGAASSYIRENINWFLFDKNNATFDPNRNITKVLQEVGFLDEEGNPRDENEHFLRNHVTAEIF